MVSRDPSSHISLKQMNSCDRIEHELEPDATAEEKQPIQGAVGGTRVKARSLA